MFLPGFKTPGTLLETLIEKILHSIWPRPGLLSYGPLHKQSSVFGLLAVSLRGWQCVSLVCLGNARGFNMALSVHAA